MARQKPKYDWPTIQTEYEAGASMPELAEKYGFAESTGYRHKRKESWKERESEKPALDHRTRKMVLDRLAGEEAELRQKYADHVDQLRAMTMEEIRSANPNWSKMKALRAAADILRSLKELDWDIRKLRDAAKQDDDEKLAEVVDAMMEAAGEEE